MRPAKSEKEWECDAPCMLPTVRSEEVEIDEEGGREEDEASRSGLSRFVPFNLMFLCRPEREEDEERQLLVPSLPSLTPNLPVEWERENGRGGWMDDEARREEEENSDAWLSVSAPLSPREMGWKGDEEEEEGRLKCCWSSRRRRCPSQSRWMCFWNHQ